MCGRGGLVGDICARCESGRKSGDVHPPPPQQARAPKLQNTRKSVGTKARRKHLTAVCVAAQNNLCALCGRPFTETRRPTLDHITPRSMRGTHARENLQAAHAECNSLKGSLTLWEFRRRVANGRIKLPEPDPPED
jgi:5-methylcytosine-specific restriction endonuclease McrA